MCRFSISNIHVPISLFVCLSVYAQVLSNHYQSIIFVCMSIISVKYEVWRDSLRREFERFVTFANAQVFSIFLCPPHSCR